MKETRGLQLQLQLHQTTRRYLCHHLHMMSSIERWCTEMCVHQSVVFEQEHNHCVEWSCLCDHSYKLVEVEFSVTVDVGLLKQLVGILGAEGLPHSCYHLF